ncbi:MAG: hypothetical protein O2856_07590 [Planctomycetota bacterium]|nr:hypothetical protein [Planctomycetota bacterium]
MINRRRVLRACISLTVGCAGFRDRTVFGAPATSSPRTNGESTQTLLNLLQETIQLCRSTRHRLEPASCEFMQTQQMCEVAMLRVQASVDDGPAFWQACSDSVLRLEVAISSALAEAPQISRISFVNLYQLRSLREHLANQIVQAIEAPSRLA